jgi:hypothetical protein
MIPQAHGVDNCSLRFYKKGRQLDLGESRSLTQFSQQNLQPGSRRFWPYAYTSGLGLIGDDRYGDYGDGDGDDGNGDGDDTDGDYSDGDDGDGDDGNGDGTEST